jgi:hypothetical protein
MTRVFESSQLNGLPYYVLLVIANHETEDRGSFPSIDTIAWETRSTPRGVQKAINVARRSGELAVQIQGGPHGTNLYRVLSGLNTAPLFPQDEPERRTPPNDVRPEPSGQVGSGERKELRGKGSSVASISSLPTFDQFWSTYPRRVGKPKARAAFEKALRRAEASAVLAGAERFRDDPNREEEFTPHPTTWLNRDGWDDPPLPARRQSPEEVARAEADRIRREKIAETHRFIEEERRRVRESS